MWELRTKEHTYMFTDIEDAQMQLNFLRKHDKDGFIWRA